MFSNQLPCVMNSAHASRSFTSILPFQCEEYPNEKLYFCKFSKTTTQGDDFARSEVQVRLAQPQAWLGLVACERALCREEPWQGFRIFTGLHRGTAWDTRSSQDSFRGRPWLFHTMGSTALQVFPTHLPGFCTRTDLAGIALIHFPA